jgi:hypothetical protein
MRKIPLFKQLKFLSLSLCIACSSQSKSASTQISICEQSGVDPSKILMQKLGGPICCSLEIENYLKRVTLRLGTLTAFREQEISILMVNNPNNLCLFFDSGKLFISRGLLVSLTDESELVAAISIAMSAKISLTTPLIKAIFDLDDELSKKDFQDLKAIFEEYSSKLDLNRCEEILSSLGYAKNSLVRVLKKPIFFNTSMPSIEQLHPFANDQIGYLGETSYQKAITPLKLIQKTYDLEEKSLEFLLENKFFEATQLINQAIYENPSEGHFYFTLSKILLEQNLISQSLCAIQEAIKLNDFNVLFYLQRAKLFELLSQSKEASYDFELINELLLSR